MDQIIIGVLKSSYPLDRKQQLLEHFRAISLQTPCSTNSSISETVCYRIISYIHSLTSVKVDQDTLILCRLSLSCCHSPECLCAIAEHLINDTGIDLSIPFVQLLCDRLPSNIGRPFLERAIFHRHELNNEALHFILLSITKSRQLNDGQRTIFYIKLIELVLFRFKTLDHSVEQVEIFCKQLSSTIEELCFDPVQQQANSLLLNDIVQGVTSGLLTCLADSTTNHEPSAALASIIDLLQENPNENLIDSFLLNIDDDRLTLCLNRLAKSFCWPCSTTKPSQWLISIWKLLLKRELGMIVAESASKSIVPNLISILGNPLSYRNAVPTLCWIFVNQPFHLRTNVDRLQNEIFQLVFNNPNFLSEHTEMNNLVEAVRYGLKSLLNENENLGENEIFNNLLRSLPRLNSIYSKNVQSMKCRISLSNENSLKDSTIRSHDKVGLMNIGNSCYLNAVVQALFACTKFRQAVLNSEFSTSNDEIFNSLQILFGFLNLSQRVHFRPEKFWLRAKPSYFEKNQQQDCQEFLRHLLDSLHEEAKRKTSNNLNFDLVKEHLMGNCVHLSQCSNCSTISESRDVFYDLSIGFQKENEEEKMFDLQNLIEKNFAWEPLTGENQFACDRCQTKHDGSRRMVLSSHPNYLTLLLKRFLHNRLTGKYEKSLDPTNLPEFIQIPTNNEIIVFYRLKAIVVHHGLSMNSGHYYAFVRYNIDDLKDKTNTNQLGWWLFNDTHVEHLTFENVSAHFRRFSSATPYVLIFERENTESSPLETKPFTINQSLQNLVERDNQFYQQDLHRRGRSSRSGDVSDVTEPYLRNTGCKDQSPDRGPPCIF